MNYDDIVEMYQSGKLAMYFGTSAGVKMFQDQGINTTFLPFFQENGEKWLMTTPYFQVALNRDLTQDEARRKKAMKVLSTMLSEEAQNRIISDGQEDVYKRQGKELPELNIGLLYDWCSNASCILFPVSYLYPGFHP